MLDILDDVARFADAGGTFGLATVVKTFNSAPRPVGAAMAVDMTGEAAGSVSGGCVEAALYELAQEVMATGRPVLQRYGVTDDDAFAVGLTCGGIIDVFVEPLSRGSWPYLLPALESLRRHEALGVATIVAGAGPLGAKLSVWSDRRGGSLGSRRLDDAVAESVRGMMDSGRSGCLGFGSDGERRGEDLSIFVQSFAPPPLLLIFGAIDFAAALARLGKMLGYHVVVCDARAVFATKRRFSFADEVVVEWPHRYLERTDVDSRTVICALTHDAKFDIPLLERALRSRAGYVGAMGSRKAHLERLERLRVAGLSEAELARLASPIGIDIGARTPEETAVSIAAEVIQAHWGGTGQRLSHLGDRPIHQHVPSGETDVDARL